MAAMKDIWQITRITRASGGVVYKSKEVEEDERGAAGDGVTGVEAGEGGHQFLTATLWLAYFETSKTLRALPTQWTFGQFQ